MAKYIKLNKDNDIIEVNDEVIGEKNYCWNCEYFCSPNGCTGLFMSTVPFSMCDEWSRASDEQLEAIKKEINECCEIEPLKNIEKYTTLLKIFKKNINKNIDNIIELCDLDYEIEELRPEFIKEMGEIEKNDKITPHKLNDYFEEYIPYEKEQNK